MDFNTLGALALELTLEALRIIQEERLNRRFTIRHEANPYVRAQKSITTSADIRTQRVYTDAFAAQTPQIKVIAEEKDPLRKHVIVSNSEPVWVVDGIDGTRNFVNGDSFGYGTQCALLLANGTVPIAFVGDGATGDVFGYYGSSGVFRLTKQGNREKVVKMRRQSPLAEIGGIHRPSVNQYHPLSQKLLRSTKCGVIRELAGGIGTTMAWLLTDKIGIFALRPHHERPWDAIPAYALCEKADMVFMRPTRNGNSFEIWKVKHTTETYMRDFDLFVMHKKRVNDFLEAVSRL